MQVARQRDIILKDKIVFVIVFVFVFVIVIVLSVQCSTLSGTITVQYYSTTVQS